MSIRDGVEVQMAHSDPFFGAAIARDVLWQPQMLS